MMKAYVWEKARETNTKPVMPFTLDELKTLIDDPELALFAKHFMEKMKLPEKEEKDNLETPDEADVKKKLLTAPGKSGV